MLRQRRARRVLWLLTLLAAPGCTDDQSGGERSPTPTSATPFPAASDASAEPPNSTADAASTNESTPGSAPATEPTGVPGITDADPFCASWAVFVGSLQSISIASAFGDLPAGELATLEVVAGPSVVAARDAIGDAFPAELESERTVVLDQRIGPFARRAERAVAELTNGGATADDLDALDEVWIEALADRVADDPVIAVEFPSVDVEGIVTGAATRFDAGVTGFADDPSLIVGDVNTPLTDTYLATHCPALASSGVGDDV